MAEGIGVFASVLVLISFLFNSAITIRLINLLGAVLFVIYGVIIGAFSVWFLNGALVFIQLYHIVRMMRDGR